MYAQLQVEAPYDLLGVVLGEASASGEVDEVTYSNKGACVWCRVPRSTAGAFSERLKEPTGVLLCGAGRQETEFCPPEQ